MRTILFLISVLFLSCKATSVSKNTANEIAGYKTEILKYRLENEDTLVDIGCGPGYVDHIISHYYPKLFFILEDLPYLIKVEEKQNTLTKELVETKAEVGRFLKNSTFSPNIEKRYQLIIGKEDLIPLPSSSFNKILCRMTLHEFVNKQKMVSELERILRPKGILTIVEAEPNFNGEVEKYCGNKYIAKESILQMFNAFTLKDTNTVNYSDRKMNILHFTK